MSQAVEFKRGEPIVYLGNIGINRRPISVGFSNPSITGTLSKRDYEPLDIDDRVGLDFMDCRDGYIPDNLKECIAEIKDQKHGLCYFELPSGYNNNSGANGVEFIRADNVHNAMQEGLSAFDNEHIGYYNVESISKALGADIGFCERLQSESPSMLGGLLCESTNGLSKLVDELLSKENWTIRDIVGDYFDWENGCASVIKYEGIMYYYYFTY